MTILTAEEGMEGVREIDEVCGKERDRICLRDVTYVVQLESPRIAFRRRFLLRRRDAEIRMNRSIIFLSPNPRTLERGGAGGRKWRICCMAEIGSSAASEVSCGGDGGRGMEWYLISGLCSEERT